MFHIIVMIDTSYSMYNRLINIINSLNNFINNLKQKNHNDIYLTVVQFNDKIKYICKLININKIGQFTTDQFNIYGSTALYDSIAEILLDLRINSVKLLTNNPIKINSLRSLGIKVTSCINMQPQQVYIYTYIYVYVKLMMYLVVFVCVYKYANIYISMCVYW